MTTPHVEEPEQAVPSTEPPVEAPLSPEEIARRTAGGVVRWLAGTVMAFWLGIIGVVVSMVRELPVLLVVSITLLFVILITTAILYFSVMLESEIFADRRVRIALGFSFGNLTVLTLITLFVKQFMHLGTFNFSILTALTLATIAAAIAVLVYAFRVNQRFIFLLALAVLLAANLVPVER